jgi:hypothetical protein
MSSAYLDIGHSRLDIGHFHNDLLGQKTLRLVHLVLISLVHHKIETWMDGISAMSPAFVHCDKADLGFFTLFGVFPSNPFYSGFRRLLWVCPTSHFFHHEETTQGAQHHFSQTRACRPTHFIVDEHARPKDWTIANTPFILKAAPLVEQAPAMRCCISMATMPIVSCLSTLIMGLYLDSIFQSSQAFLATSVKRFSFLKPCSRANLRAPSPTSMTWGVFSMTRRATLMGCMMCSRKETEPANPFSSIIQASSVTCHPGRENHHNQHSYP